MIAMHERQQNSTVHSIPVLLVSSTNHISGVASPTVTLFQISKDGGGTWATPVGALTATAYGWHSWAPAAADRDTLGELVLHVEATGCDPYDEKYDIVAYDPYAYPTLPAAERTAIADAILTRDWTQVAAIPARCVLQALRFLRNKWWIDVGGQLNVTAENDSTVAWTGLVQTQAGADPITGQTPT
jgi:hypothetical protein